jgi:hypothetical protein
MQQVALAPFTVVGRLVIGVCTIVGALSLFVGRTLLACFTPRWHGGQIARQVVSIGFLSLPVVGLTAVFTGAALAGALPASVRAIAVLDRCKEPGSQGEPLYLDVLAALAEQWPELHPGRPLPRLLGGRYGLASKEFTPARAKAVFVSNVPLISVLEWVLDPGK